MWQAIDREGAARHWTTTTLIVALDCRGMRCATTAHHEVDRLWADTQRMLDAITPSDAANFFRHCGYTLRVES